MTDYPGTELRKLLTTRVEVLEAIDDRPQRKPSLVETVESSRSTIDRAVGELVKQGCIDASTGEYHTTPLGRIALNVHRDYVERIDDVVRAREVLNENQNLADLPAAFLRDVEVSVADPSLPEAALEPSVELLQHSDRLLGLAPVVLASYIELVEAGVTENDLTAEIVIHDSTVPKLLEYRDSLSEVIDSGAVTLYVTEEELPYSLWLMESADDAVAGITVHQNGGVRGMLMNAAPQAVVWARDQYESYKAEAMKYEPENG